MSRVLTKDRIYRYLQDTMTNGEQLSSRVQTIKSFSYEKYFSAMYHPDDVHKLLGYIIDICTNIEDEATLEKKLTELYEEGDNCVYETSFIPQYPKK